MMKRILAGATSATLVATLLSPVAFAATLEISGNGGGSNNTVTVKTNKKPSKKVTQRNRLRVSALVESVAGTDLNDTSNNTTNGGNVGVTTDNADAASM